VNIPASIHNRNKDTKPTKIAVAALIKTHQKTTPTSEGKTKLLPRPSNSYISKFCSHNNEKTPLKRAKIVLRHQT